MGVDFLNGWDAMVATSQANVNQGLLLAYQDGLLPKHADAQFTLEFFGVKIPASVSGELGAWTFAGGSGKNVVVGIPFTGGSATVGQLSYPLAGVVLQVTTLLTYIKSPVRPSGGTDYTITVDFTSPDAIVAVNVLNPPPNIPITDIEIILLNYLKNALGGHTYDIATVSLAYVEENYPYLVPTLFEYAVDTNSADPNSSIFGVQMLTVNTAPGNQDIVPGTVPGGTPACDSAALLSNQLFAQKLILPGLAGGIKVDESQLTTHYVGGAWTVINNGDITLDQSHSPVLTSVVASVDDNALTVSLVGNVEASPGITIDFTVQATYALQVSTDGSTQTLNLVQQGDPIVNHTVHVATWVIIVASALAALVVAVMGPIVGLILAGIEALIIFLVTKIAGDQAGKLLNSSIPATVSANVNWTYLQDFTIQQALMPTPLQLGGTIPALQSPH